MQAGHALFQLIGTLSPSEQRNFRIFVGRHVIGEENKYLELFDAIVANADDAQFFQRPAHQHFNHNFSYNAHYLYQLILRSLQSFHYEAHPSQQMRSLMDKMELLMQRQLYDQADKLYRKLMKEAEKLEDFGMMLQGLQIKRQWLRSMGDKSIWEELPAIHDKIAFVLAQIANENDIGQCYSQFFLVTQNQLYLNKTDEDAALQAILGRPILQDEGKVKTFNGRIAWHFIHAFNHTLKARHPEAEPHFRRLVQIWEEQPRQIALQPERYAMTIVDLLNCWHSLDRYEDFEAYLTTIRRLSGLPTAGAQRIHWIITNLEVLFFLNTLRIDDANEVVKRWEDVLHQNENRVSEVSILSFSFNISLLYFIQENFSISLKWVNRILNHPRTLARSDVQRFARTLYLVLQIELDNLELLETELANARRALQQTGFNVLEKALLSLLGKLIVRPKSEWRRHQQRFSETLMDISQSGDIPFGLQEMSIWIESRLEGRSMAQQLRLANPS